MKRYFPHAIACFFILLTIYSLHAAQSEEEIRLDHRVADAKAQFLKGDYASIDQAAKDHDLLMLWHIFRSASRAREQRAELWDAVESRVRQALLSHPDHATFLGNKLEGFSTDHTKNPLRERYFKLLGAFGGPDAIAQLGRFILDDRNPMPPYIIPGKTVGPYPSPNSMWAAWALNEALEEESPWKPYRDKNGHVFQSPTAPLLDEIMKQWWIETGSKKYGLGIQAAVHPTPKPVAQPPPVIDPDPAPSEPWAWELPAIIALVLLSVLLVCIKKRP